jgi:hypothetical protein
MNASTRRAQQGTVFIYQKRVHTSIAQSCTLKNIPERKAVFARTMCTAYTGPHARKSSKSITNSKKLKPSPFDTRYTVSENFDFLGLSRGVAIMNNSQPPTTPKQALPARVLCGHQDTHRKQSILPFWHFCYQRLASRFKFCATGTAPMAKQAHLKQDSLEGNTPKRGLRHTKLKMYAQFRKGGSFSMQFVCNLVAKTRSHTDTTIKDIQTAARPPLLAFCRTQMLKNEAHCAHQSTQHQTQCAGMYTATSTTKQPLLAFCMLPTERCAVSILLKPNLCAKRTGLAFHLKHGINSAMANTTVSGNQERREHRHYACTCSPQPRVHTRASHKFRRGEWFFLFFVGSHTNLVVKTRKK